jgi:GT2 family glycosyltransferase/spore maturation protein CgeB
VVDNGPTDETSGVLDVRRSFPLKVISNERNMSFSEGNNQGVEAAEGEYLLFLSSDVEPINPGWLGAMVEAIEIDDSHVGVGAELVYPVRGKRSTDLTVQHTGIRFKFRDQAVRAVNIGDPDPLADRLAGVAEVPAATAAALLVSREAFNQVGGFDEGYVYGTEDVDLCLKLGELGKVVVTGQAVLFHHESATQTKVASDITRVNRLGNRLRFAEHWGPRVTRSVRRDEFSEVGYWAPKRQRTVGITLTHDDVSDGWGDYYTAHELGDAFAAAGWKVLYLERYQDRWYDVDEGATLLISLLDSFDVRRAPSGAFTIAWVRNWVDRWLGQPWFESYHMVATSSGIAARHISNRSRFEPALIPMATNPQRFSPGPPNPTFESAYAFTGNNWGPGRSILRLLDVEPEERFLLFGRGWDKDPRMARYWRGHLSYELLPEVYRSTKIVLDDTAGPTRPHGFVNGRTFDALASGALVVSDNVQGSEEMFDGLLPTYSDRQELRSHLDHFLGDESDRIELVGKLRERVLTRHSYSARPEEFVRLASNHIERPHAAIKIAVPNEEVGARWGDTHFGGALASELTSIGLPTEVHILPEWDLPANQAVDVVIHLRGLANYSPKPAHINVLWIISHPDDVSIRECERYDVVLVASRRHADWLRRQIQTPVIFMPQATDGRRFRPLDPRQELESDVLFLGNSRGMTRPAVEWAIAEGLPLTVYGGGWKGRIPVQFLRADHFPNENLAALYASSKVVLNDHWPDMREKGFISNRIFDALASGVVVVSDRVAGLEEVFGDLVPTYGDSEELAEAVRGLLDDDERRRSISYRASAVVAEKHTFAHRAGELMAILEPLLAQRKKDMEGTLFSLTAAADRPVMKV